MNIGFEVPDVQPQLADYPEWVPCLPGEMIADICEQVSGAGTDDPAGLFGDEQKEALYGMRLVQAALANEPVYSS